MNGIIKYNIDETSDGNCNYKRPSIVSEKSNIFKMLFPTTAKKHDNASIGYNGKGQMIYLEKYNVQV